MFAFTAFFGSLYLVMVADAVPTFDVKQTCRGSEAAGVYPGRNMESCVQSEEARRGFRHTVTVHAATVAWRHVSIA